MYQLTREERTAHKYALQTLVEIHLDTRAASDKLYAITTRSTVLFQYV